MDSTILIPTPLHDLWRSVQADDKVSVGGVEFTKQAAIAVTVGRLFFAAVYCSAIVAGVDLVLIGVVGTIVSLPATLIAAGATVTYYGIALLVQSTASGVLLHFVIGSAATIGGLGMIQGYCSITNLSLADQAVKRLFS